VKNIVENAMKYSSDGCIFIEILNNSILFNNKIENNISQKEINKITTDFYQLDTSRNSV
jgi:signal transduction histidine kinase